MTEKDDSGPYLDYQVLVQEALRWGVVRRALNQVATHGLFGDHHFYLTFRTDIVGVDIPNYLRAQYPEEMTIVLQNQFADLIVEDAFFSVTLHFNIVPERLTVPIRAITEFVDPSQDFALQFSSESAPEAENSAPDGSSPNASSEASDQEEPGKIISLDDYRNNRS